ncbi:uncharacterized protein LOC134258357 [Saccostrea cucullata]|uniref:uncharacterized protein LOC134258357 n=1 Tax=Saccostrea cuccullata TaxID=36930 RepID=UPI002ECFD223
MPEKFQSAPAAITKTKKKVGFKNVSEDNSKAVKPIAPPPPPPPVKAPQSQQRPLITTEDLLLAKSRLNRESKRLSKRTISRADIYDKFKETDFIPLDFTISSLWKETLDSQSIITQLNLSGIEQLTDMFFDLLGVRKVDLPHLTLLNINGCCNLTDFGIYWIVQNLHEITAISMKGCTEVTERSVHYITDGKMNLRDCQMSSTQCRAIPLKLEKSLGLFSFKACPLISPSTETYVTHPISALAQGYSSSQLDQTGNDWINLDKYKVVILNEGENTSLGERITNKPSSGKGVQTWLDWKPKADSSVTINLIEIDRKSNFEGLVMSNGSVVILPFSDKSPSYIQKIAGTILSIVSQYPETGFLICNPEYDATPATEHKLKDIIHRVKDTLTVAMESLAEELNKEIKDKWRLNEFRFHDQIVYTAGRKLIHHMEKIIARKNKKDDSTQLLQYMLLGKEDQCFDAIDNLILDLQDHYPWHTFHYFATIRKLIELKYKPDKFKGNLGYLKQLIKAVDEPPLSNLNMKDPYKEMIQILSLRHERGMGTLYPDIRGYPSMTSFAVLETLVTGIMESPPDKKGFIKGLGIAVPCYRKEDFTVIFGQSMNMRPRKMEDGDHFDQVELLLDILENSGCLMKFPCDLKGPGYEDTLAYVLFRDIPDQPPVSLVEYWPEEVPKTERQAQKFYRFPALPPNFMSTLLREFSHLLQFTVLWKGGFICQQGPVYHLLELLDTDGGSTIVVSSRVQNPNIISKAAFKGDNDGLESMLWNGFKQICSILDAHIQKNRIYVQRYYTCHHCVPSGSRYQAADSEKFTHFSELKILGGHDRGLHCKKIGNKEAEEETQVSLINYFGPDFQRKDTRHLPNHSCFDVEYEKMIEDTVATRSNYTRCFMCGNCSRENLQCYANVESGKTVRHCGCLIAGFLCKYCGVCRFCVQRLARAHCVIHPQFQSESLISSMGETDLSQNGNFVFFSSNSEYKFSQPLSIEYFSHLRACMHRGHFILNVTSPSCRVQVSCHEKFIKQTQITPFKETEKILHVLAPYHNGVVYDIFFDINKSDLCGQFLRIVQNKKTVLDLAVSDRNMFVSISCVHPGSVSLSSNHMIEMPKITTVAHGFTGTATAKLQILGGSSIYDEDMKKDILAGVKENELKPFCQVKLDSEVVYKTKVQSTSSPRFNETAKFQIDDPDSVVEIEVYEFDHIDSILLGVVMLTVQQLRELSNQEESKLHHLNGTSNGKIRFKCTLTFNDEDNEKALSKKFTNNRGDMYIPKCCTWIPTVAESNISQMAAAFEDRLNIRDWVANIQGVMVLILPNIMTKEMVLFPKWNSMENDQIRFHPLCNYRLENTRLNSGESDTWEWHILDAPGFQSEGNLANTVFLWVTQCVLLNSPVKLELSTYEKLFPELAKEPYINANMILHSINSYLNFSSVHKHIFRGIDYAVKHFLKSKKLEVQTMKFVHKSVSNNFESTGLEVVPSFFNTKHFLFLCPGHRCSYVRSQGISEVSLRGFDTYGKFIQNLVLTKNNLTTLPKEVFSTLKHLKIVDVSENILESLPETIGQCEFLEILRLQENNLRDLPMELAQCTNLQVLNISRNLMDELPLVVTMCSSLEQLYLNDMFLTHLPDDIGCLDNLEILYAKGNCFTSLPDSFVMLQRLTDLSLRGVLFFVSSPSYIMSRDRFEELLEVHGMARWLDAHNEDKEELFKSFDEDGNGILDQNEIGRLNATIYNIFPRFGYKGKEIPDENTDSGFPMQILQIQNLRYLDLTYQGLVHIPDSISFLTSLQHLNVSYNPHLLDISASVGSLPLLTLGMTECPLLKTPPREIRDQGFTACYAYLRRLLSGSVECKRTKLMLVGLGEAGKTSLARALQSSDLKSSLTGHESITDGIDISTWKISQDNEEISYSVWDFAGQTVYYNTHYFFLSNRAVYFLVWNVRLGHEHAGLKFWLSSISVHAPKAPVLIVGTHVDQVSKIELPMEELKASFSQIQGFFFVSSLTGQGLDELKEKLVSVTLTQGYMGESIPMAWLELEDIIKKLKTKTKMDTIDYDQLFKRASVAGIVDEKEFAEAVAFLHDLGCLQHFSGNEYLHSKVVVNPQWIVDVMACVVSVKESPIKNGRLNHKDLNIVWKDYPESLHQWLLRLTEEFDLTFFIPPEEGSKDKVNLVPCLLPENKPKFEWPEADKKSGITETKMVYLFDYLPAGLFNRGQVRLQEYSDYYIIWKKGSYLKKDGQIAILQQTKDTEMVVRVQGKMPEIVLFHIHEVFESLILEAYQGVRYDFTISCPDCLKHSAKDPHMFLASTIRRAIELKAPFLQCMAYFHTISVVDLQSVMPPTSNNDFDVHIQKAVSGLQDLRRNMKIDLFLSYCVADAPADDKNVIHPAQVHQDLKNAGYTCWFPEESNQYSTDLMARALMDSTIFVVFVSTNYANDRSCTDIFKYAKLTLGKPMVVIVVGEDNYSWRKTNLGLLLPDVSFVNMINSKKYNYNSKFQELLGKLDELMNLTGKVKDRESPECFISYCWKNSAQAVALGTRSGSASLGFGDPREIKSYLEENCINCWIDVERIGMNGLFDEIAKGLLESRVVVACVSDDYVESPSCCKEFRYACTVLNLPIVICVVGTGHKWRRSEVAMLSVNYPVVSFQLESDEAHPKLLQLVEETLASSNQDNKEKEKKKEGTSDKDKDKQFKELYELAQRKFLRQITKYASNHDVEPYPRLFVADIVPLEENIPTLDKSLSIEEKFGNKEENQLEKGETEVINSGFVSRRFSINILCECDQGWHSVDKAMMLPEDFGTEYLKKYAPYLSRITAIMKHSKNYVMDCMTDEDGQNYMKWLFESADAVLPDFMKDYQDLRELVMEMDSQRTYGCLSRCRLSSGKVIWLCEEHIKDMKVTVLAKDAVAKKNKVSNPERPEYIAEWLRKVDSEKLMKKFDSSEKVKRKFDQSLVDKALVVADDVRQHAGIFGKAMTDQLLKDISQGLTPGQIKSRSQQARAVLRHGSAIRRQEIQKPEAVVKRHATTSVTSADMAKSPPKSGESTPKLKRPTSQACSVM